MYSFVRMGGYCQQIAFAVCSFLRYQRAFFLVLDSPDDAPPSTMSGETVSPGPSSILTRLLRFPHGTEVSGGEAICYEGWPVTSHIHQIAYVQIMQDTDDLTAELEGIEIDQSNIVWDTDREDFFGNFETENLNTVSEHRGGREITVPVNQDEQFMHWLRPAAHPGVLPPL